jgi:hypothetical protein
MLLATIHPSAHGLAITDQEKSRPNSCVTAEPDSAGSNDMLFLKVHGAFIRQLLEQEKFKELNCIADSERSSKERLPGGMWRIHEFYWAINNLQGHPSQEGWKDHLKLVQSWVAATPNSITARVVLAQAYIDYAWDARGGETGDTVTNSGWKLFGQRLEQAKATLDEASALPSKCPEWYYAMLRVALGQGWDRTKVEELVERVIASEPGYYYIARTRTPSCHSGMARTAMQPNSPSRLRTASEEMLEIFFTSRLARKSFARAMNPSSGDCRGRGFRRDTRYWRSDTACHLRT